jgi:hypothetical protein
MSRRILEIEDDPWWLVYLVFWFPPVALVLLFLAMLLFPNGPRVKVIRSSEPMKIVVIDQRGE